MRDYSKYHYTAEDLRFLKEEEQRLGYESFGAREALALTEKIIEIAEEEYQSGIYVKIRRLNDNATMVEYTSDDKNERNAQFAQGKVNACLSYGHSSFYAFVKENVEGHTERLFPGMEMNQAAGAYPVFVNGEMAAVIGVSGLKEGNDHRLIVKALCAVQGKEYVPFEKEIL